MTFHSYHNRNSVTMLRQRKSFGVRSPMSLLSPLQLLLATLSTLTAGAVLGTAAHAFSVYRKGHAANNPWWLPLWPQHFDTANTEALIATAGGVVLLNFVYILLRLLPKVRGSHLGIAQLLNCLDQSLLKAFTRGDHNCRDCAARVTHSLIQHHIQLCLEQAHYEHRHNTDVDVQI